MRIKLHTAISSSATYRPLRCSMWACLYETMRSSW